MTKNQTRQIKVLQQDVKALSEAIKAKCLDCSAGSAYERKNCFSQKCHIFPYREGFESQKGDSTQGFKGSEATNAHFNNQMKGGLVI